MNKKVAYIAHAFSRRLWIGLILLGLLCGNSLLAFSCRSPLLLLALNNYFLASLLLFLIIAAVCVSWGALMYLQKKPRTWRTLFALSPLLLLNLWPLENARMPAGIAFCIVALMLPVFYYILIAHGSRPRYFRLRAEKIILTLCIILYAWIFCSIATRLFNNYSILHPKDFAIYNQTFWNTIHGRIFENSAYGSNLACHQTFFFIFLVPIYYLIPHPLTLLVAKILLLSASAIPAYLIAKTITPRICPLPLVIAFLCNPFIIGQNFNPPYEIGFAPFFIMYAYYFFLKKNFGPFFVFLIATLLIKEHLALVAVMYGVIGLIKKRQLRWIAWPLILGIAWAAFSIKMLSFFQALYHTHPDGAWYMTYLTQNLQQPSGLMHLAKASLHSIPAALPLIMPLGILPAFLSVTALLSIPEFLVNAASGRPVMFSPLWHYNIVTTCFLWIATLEGIRKISCARVLWKHTRLSPLTMQHLLSATVFSFTLMQSYTWIDAGHPTRSVAYSNAVRSALAYIPPEAPVGAPAHIALMLSGRKEYRLLDSTPETGLPLLITDDTVTDDATLRYIEKWYTQVSSNDYVHIFRHKKSLLAPQAQ